MHGTESRIFLNHVYCKITEALMAALKICSARRVLYMRISPENVPGFRFLLAPLLLAFMAPGQSSFASGQVWLDEAGKPIQSHAGGLLFDHETYYWYGMDFRSPRIPPGTLPRQGFAWLLNVGITVYSSRDLLHWKAAPNQLTDVGYAPANLLQPTQLLVRPKVIRNATTGKYILMAALTAPDFETVNDVVFAEADRPQGPFRFMGKLGWCGHPNAARLWSGPWVAGTGLPAAQWRSAAADPPERIRGFDMTLFEDDDGKAYLITAHSRVLLYELGASYTCAARVAIMQGAEGEAPALLKDRGTYYLLASRLTGWFPNQNTYFTSSSIDGPWTPRGPFAKGSRQQTTFDGQTTFVLPLQGNPHAFIYIADRFGAVSGEDIPDFGAATHIWLPIEIDPIKHALTVNWKDNWDLSAFPSLDHPQ
jgi:hypothetical protein